MGKAQISYRKPRTQLEKNPSAAGYCIFGSSHFDNSFNMPNSTKG